MLENKNIEKFLKLDNPEYFINVLPINKKVERVVLNTRIEL